MFENTSKLKYCTYKTVKIKVWGSGRMNSWVVVFYLFVFLLNQGERSRPVSGGLQLPCSRCLSNLWCLLDGCRCQKWISASVLARSPLCSVQRPEPSSPEVQRRASPGLPVCESASVWVWHWSRWSSNVTNETKNLNILIDSRPNHTLISIGTYLRVLQVWRVSFPLPMFSPAERPCSDICPRSHRRPVRHPLRHQRRPGVCLRLRHGLPSSVSVHRATEVNSAHEER